MRIIREQTEEDMSDDMADNMSIDATDIEEAPAGEEVMPLTSEGERYLIDLLIKAFLHEPDISEKNIVKELQASVFEDNPKEISDAISNLLEIGPEEGKDQLDDITDVGPRL